jgi:glucose uptake protein GlcU
MGNHLLIDEMTDSDLNFYLHSDKGLNYVLSFAVGAAIVTLTGWILLFLKHSYHTKSFRSGYDLLPSMYFDKIGHLGVFSGVLWSIGNIGQIYTVSVLGESIGMSIVQSQMVVSGILGIAWFREIRGFQNVSGWIISALFTLGGIFTLSHEHKI